MCFPPRVGSCGVVDKEGMCLEFCPSRAVAGEVLVPCEVPGSNLLSLCKLCFSRWLNGGN